jgi:tRNA (guanine-N(7)-)-methyltransferase subunit TRM82
MALPYQCLYALPQSSILCASRGASIYTFDTASGSGVLVSSWHHPLSRQQEETKFLTTDISKTQSQEETKDQPPVKKRKIGTDADDSRIENGAVEADEVGGLTAAPAADADEKGQSKGRKTNKKATRSQEQPFVNLLTATSNGSHIIAVTGQDKTLWVLEHDGKGALRELSQRYVAMASYGVCSI